jgi:hypothetical protein
LSRAPPQSIRIHFHYPTHRNTKSKWTQQGFWEEYSLKKKFSLAFSYFTIDQVFHELESGSFWSGSSLDPVVLDEHLLSLQSGPLKMLTGSEPTAVSPQAETATERLEPPLDETGSSSLLDWKMSAVGVSMHIQGSRLKATKHKFSPIRLLLSALYGQPWMPLFS